MPKQKTRKSVKKRFKVTKSGKVLRRKGFRRHLNVKKSAKKKRQGKKMVETNKSYAKRVKKALGVKEKKKKDKKGKDKNAKSQK